MSYHPRPLPDGFIKVTNLLLVSCLYVSTRLFTDVCMELLREKKAKGKDLCAQHSLELGFPAKLYSVSRAPRP